METEISSGRRRALARFIHEPMSSPAMRGSPARRYPKVAAAQDRFIYKTTTTGTCKNRKYIYIFENKKKHIFLFSIFASFACEARFVSELLSEFAHETRKIILGSVETKRDSLKFIKLNIR